MEDVMNAYIKESDAGFRYWGRRYHHIGREAEKLLKQSNYNNQLAELLTEQEGIVDSLFAEIKKKNPDLSEKEFRILLKSTTKNDFTISSVEATEQRLPRQRIGQRNNTNSEKIPWKKSNYPQQKRNIANEEMNNLAKHIGETVNIRYRIYS